MAKIDFYGKNIVYNEHLNIPIDNLIFDSSKSYNTTNQSIINNNLIIKGNNVKSLKSLLPYYQGKIDIIYIDPPYNTGTTDSDSGFVYDDNMDNPAFKNWLNENYIKKDDLDKHDKWLCYMWTRLQISKELLSDNGVIFISVDDNENMELGLIMKEIFGQDNTEHIIWKKVDPKYDKNTNAKKIKRTKRIHEYIHIGFKNKELNNFGKIMKLPNWLNEYGNKDNDPRGNYKEGIISFQEGHAKEDKTSPYYYSITLPSGRLMTRHFFVLKNEFDKLIKDNRIYFPKDGDGVPAVKIFEDEEKEFAMETILEGLGSLNKAKSELEEIFGAEYLKSLFGEKETFSTPKPVKLIKEIIRAASNNKSCIVLDYFAGSGTTAQAVLDLNAEDGGNRKFIMIEQMDYVETLVCERIKKTHNKSSFNFFSITPRINKERLFSKNSLPSMDELQKQLNINVFNCLDGVDESLRKIEEVDNLYILGNKNGNYLAILYNPNWDWLCSNESSITENTVDILAKQLNDYDNIYLYATSRFIAYNDLLNKKIHFLRLPFDI